MHAGWLLRSCLLDTCWVGPAAAGGAAAIAARSSVRQHTDGWLAHSSLAPCPPARSPLREVIFAIRAILPLVVALTALILLVLRRPLPAVTWAVQPSGVRSSDGDTASEADTADASVHSRSALSRASVAVTACMMDKGGDETTDEDTAHGTNAAAAALAAARTDVEEGGAASGGVEAARPGLAKRLWASYGSFFTAVAVCQVGMITFNIGEWAGCVQAGPGAAWRATQLACRAACRHLARPGWHIRLP